MSVFNKVHQQRINRLTRAILRARSYNQRKVEHLCGSPACMMGYTDAIFGVREVTRAGGYRKFLFGSLPRGAGDAAERAYYRDFTSTFGCDMAGRSGKKAVAFVRQMARDLKAALAA